LSKHRKKNFSDRPFIYGFRDNRTALRQPPTPLKRAAAGRCPQCCAEVRFLTPTLCYRLHDNARVRESDPLGHTSFSFSILSFCNQGTRYMSLKSCTHYLSCNPPLLRLATVGITKYCHSHAFIEIDNSLIVFSVTLI